MRFANEPMRTFSSGMVARLGILIASVATPTLLIIDEIQSVGRRFEPDGFKAHPVEGWVDLKHFLGDLALGTCLKSNRPLRELLKQILFEVLQKLH